MVLGRLLRLQSELHSLTGILGNASLARLDLPPSSDTHAYLDQIVQSS